MPINFRAKGGFFVEQLPGMFLVEEERRKIYESSGVVREQKARALQQNVEGWIAEHIIKSPVYFFAYETRGGRLYPEGSMDLLVEMSTRAINNRQALGLEGKRERAETEGIIVLEQMVNNLENGGYFLWASPAPPTEERKGEYKDYGFIFIGKKEENKIQMISWRWEERSDVDYARFLNFFKQETEKEFSETDRDTDFLQRPIEVKKELTSFLKRTLQEEGVIDYQNPLLKQILEEVRPTVDQFIELSRQKIDQEITKRAFASVGQRAVEVYAKIVGGLKNKDWRVLAAEVKQEAVVGYCGGSGDILGNNFSQEKVLPTQFGNHECSIGVCPNCGNRETLAPKQVNCSVCGTYLS